MSQKTYIARKGEEAQLRYPVVAKTAAYTIRNEDLGTIITNRGDGDALTLTLPATTEVESGWWCEVLVIADQTVTVAAGTADTLLTFNDIAADSVAYSTAGQKIGAHAKIIFDGTAFAFINLGTHTATVAT